MQSSTRLSRTKEKRSRIGHLIRKQKITQIPTVTETTSPCAQLPRQSAPSMWLVLHGFLFWTAGKKSRNSRQAYYERTNVTPAVTIMSRRMSRQLLKRGGSESSEKSARRRIKYNRRRGAEAATWSVKRMKCHRECHANRWRKIVNGQKSSKSSTFSSSENGGAS